LNSFALGLKDPQANRPVEMTDLQVKAALGLLRKTLPDLAMTQVETSGGSGNHLHFHLEAAQRVSAQLQAEPKRRVIIEHEQQDVPSASLLDAPLPEE
jgi:DNA primase